MDKFKMISFSAFFYSFGIAILSLSQFFFNNTEFKNIWSPPGIEPRTACIAHKRSATELRQPAGEQTLQFCIYAVKGYCYATVSLSTDH